MIEATKKLREPAGFVLVGYVAVALLFSIIDLLFGETAEGATGIASFTKFTDRAFQSTQQFFNPGFALLIVIAVIIVNGFGPFEGRTPQAKIVTLVAVADFAVALLFGLISLFSTFGSDATGRDNIEKFFGNVASGAVVAVGAWFVWMVYQGYLPAKPATGNWQGGPPPGFQPQQQPWGQQPPQGYQPPPPGGFGYPQQPGQPGQQPPAPPTQFIPQGGQPPQGGESAPATQVFPPVGAEPPTTTADQPPAGEQPWSPGGTWSPQG